MNANGSYEIIMNRLCKEIDQIAEQIHKNDGMSVQDLEKIDKLFHAKKSMLTAKAMEESSKYENEDGTFGDRMTYSGRRSRGAGESYAEGYDRGYSEAMSRGTSGHYPPYYPVRW